MPGDSYLDLQGRQTKGVGSPEWNAAFPGGASGVSTALPPNTDLGLGFIPETGGRGAINTGNPWKGG
jgi:hypothetical protein